MQDLTPVLNTMLKQKTGVTSLVKLGMKELEETMGLLKKLGIKFQVCKLLNQMKWIYIMAATIN